MSTLRIFVHLCALGYEVHNWNGWGQSDKIFCKSETIGQGMEEDTNSGTRVANSECKFRIHRAG